MGYLSKGAFTHGNLLSKGGPINGQLIVLTLYRPASFVGGPPKLKQIDFFDCYALVRLRPSIHPSMSKEMTEQNSSANKFSFDLLMDSLTNHFSSRP